MLAGYFSKLSRNWNSVIGGQGRVWAKLQVSNNVCFFILCVIFLLMYGNDQVAKPGPRPFGVEVLAMLRPS